MAGHKKFDDIRPYVDDEIPAAMARIADDAHFPQLSSFVFPEADVDDVRRKIRSIRSTGEFQSQVMSCMNARVIDRSISEFTYDGLENLSPDTRYLFVGNHRDIVLDSSLMQYVLYCNGHETSEITFGANLMQNRLMVDIGKSNKMFKVERPGGGIKEFYRASMHLSEYIRHTIADKRQSVWIAQRNGRTKDGMDLTDKGLVKMLGMSRGGRKSDSMAELHIAPVAISYEWEPCDLLKARELYECRRDGHYEKKPGEDVNSILTGILEPKGRVHLSFCRPLSRGELSEYDACPPGEFERAVAALIDRRIHRAYRLTPNNYIAHDLRYGKDEYAGRYTAGQKAEFTARLRGLERYGGASCMDALTDIFLGIYSNPVNPYPDETREPLH